MTKPHKEINTTLASTPFLGKKFIGTLALHYSPIVDKCPLKRLFQVVYLFAKRGFLKFGVSLFDQLFVVSEA